MIIEDIFEFEYNKKEPPTPFEIEEFIKLKGVEPIRYSILNKEGNIFKISISGIKD